MLALFRFALTTIILLPLSLIKDGKPGFSKREWLQLTAAAIFGTTLYFLFEYQGLLYTTASNASLILAVLPVLTMVASFLLHKKRYPLRCWLGVLLTLCGVYLVVLYGGDEQARNPLLGNLLLLGACVCWVIYIEVSYALLARHGSLKLTAYQSVLGTLTLIPCSLTELNQLQPIGMGGIFSAIFLGLVCSALCYIMYQTAIKHLQPFRTALFISLNPVAAVIGGVLLLNESLALLQVLGGLIILLSILYVNRVQSE